MAAFPFMQTGAFLQTGAFVSAHFRAQRALVVVATEIYGVNAVAILVAITHAVYTIALT